MDISKICDALGNETRYQIVKALKDKTLEICGKRMEFCKNDISVGDVVKATGLAQSTVSQHLQILVNSGVIIREKRGPWTCFLLNEQLVEDFLSELNQDLR